MLVFLVLVSKVSKVTIQSEGNSTASVEHQFKTVLVEPILRPIVVSGYGTVDAVQRYFLYPQVQGEVVEKIAHDGQVLQKGDVLLRLNGEVGELQLESLRALFKERTMEYQAAKELKDSGYLSEVKLSSALAALKKAETDLRAMEKQIENHIVRAPVSGILGKINVVVGDVVSPGVTLLAELVPFGDCVIRMHVSDVDVVNLKEGLESEVVLPGVGLVSGKIKFASLIPSTSGMFPVEIHIDQKVLAGHRVPVGVMVDSKIIVDKKLLYKVPGSALSLAGQEVVVNIMKNAMPHQLVVEVIEEDNGSFWVHQDETKGKIEVIVAGSLQDE